MALAYDAIGTAASGVNVSGSAAAGTPVSITATLGADVFVGIQVAGGSGPAPSNVKLDGVAMTLVDFQSVANAATTNGTYVYRAIGAGTGSAQSVTYTIPNSTWYVANAISATGAGSVSVTKASGSSAALSSGSITLTTGQLAICFYGAGFSAIRTMSSATGGTNRYLGTTTGTAGEADLAISTATSTATFGASLNSTGGPWSSVALVVSPSTAITPGAASATATMAAPAVTAPYVDQPGGATVTATGATPTLGASPTVVTPGAASIAATMGTPAVTAPQVETPTAAAASATTGTPSVSSGLGLARVLSNLSNGYNSTLCALGDSTVQGLFDSATPVLGWFGRLGALIGRGLDVNVQLYSLNQTTEVGSVHSLTGGWSSATTLWTSSLGGSAPTLSLYNAGVGGSQLIHDEVFITNSDVMAAFTNADGIFTGTGFNDIDGGASAATYTSRYQTLITNLRSDFPGVPITITTENQTPDSNHTAIYAGVAAMVLAFTGKSWPLSTPLTASTVANVCVLDTWQAFDGLTLSDVINQPASDGYNLHPNGEGYAVQASWMLDELAPELPQTLVTPIGATVSASPSAPAVTAPYVDQPGGGTVTATGSAPALPGPTLVTPGGATGTAAGASPVVTAPDTVTPAAASGSATGGTPDVDIASASTVVPQPTTVTATPATPVVTAPDTVTPDGASIDAVGGTPQIDLTVHPAGGSTAATGSPPVVTAPDTPSPSGATVTATPSTPVVTTGAEAPLDDSTTLLDPSLAPTLSFERPQDPFGNSWTQLGDFPALVELSAPTSGPSFEGVQTTDVTAFTPGGTLFVPRGTAVQAGDRITYQDRKYLLMGARNWDLDHPLTGVDFGWMTFALQSDPRQLISDLLALRGQQITLVPIVATPVAGGGNKYTDGTPRDPQLFVLTNTKGLDGREDSQTDRGMSRKFQFELVGASSSVIALGDKWEDDVAKYTVESVDRTKFYNVEALVTGFLKVTGHSFG